MILNILKFELKFKTYTVEFTQKIIKLMNLSKIYMHNKQENNKSKSPQREQQWTKNILASNHFYEQKYKLWK